MASFWFILSHDVITIKTNEGHSSPLQPTSSSEAFPANYGDDNEDGDGDDGDDDDDDDGNDDDDDDDDDDGGEGDADLHYVMIFKCHQCCCTSTQREK